MAFHKGPTPYATSWGGPEGEQRGPEPEFAPPEQVGDGERERRGECRMHQQAAARKRRVGEDVS